MFLVSPVPTDRYYSNELKNNNTKTGNFISVLKLAVELFKFKSTLLGEKSLCILSSKVKERKT